MEKFDAEKAARVWQRVQSREEAGPMKPDFGTLIRQAQEQAACYRALSRVLPGKNPERMREFWRQQQRAGDCLKGICRISGIPIGPGAGTQVRTGSLGTMLESCCHGERRLVAEYYARTGDPEWGRVYAHLAAEAVQRCAVLLEILGAAGR